MGLHMSARCPCGYSRAGLRLGGTHAQIGAHDVSCYEVYAASCCPEVQSVLIYMGQPLPTDVPCEACGEALVLAEERRYRISTLKGERWGEHGCPRCRADTLEFEPGERFL